MARAAVIPSVWGIRMSVKMTSGWCVAARGTASAPVAAVATNGRSAAELSWLCYWSQRW